VLVMADPVEDASKAYAEAKRLLAKADFDAARAALRFAAVTDPDNRQYRDEYAMLRQVLRTREQINREIDHAKWLGMARSLHTYYHANGIYGEALELDREVHRREGTSESAAMLAETLLAFGRPTEAVEVLRSVSKDKSTARTDVLLGLALARAGRLDEAKSLAREATADTAEPRVFFELACLRALTGDASGAFEALTGYFQQTPPDQLEAAKAEAKACSDFGTLTGNPGFAAALDTQSQVPQSTCSGGTDCGSCPMRKSSGSCAAQGSAQSCRQKKDKP
jgi:predicted Zn-dependent protease